MIARRRFHRRVFLVAGLYNLGWGVFSGIDPQWLFRFAGMPLQNYPEVFACLGMVIGLYGILYLEVARMPERGWHVAAVGLLGKLLGPMGLILLLWRGQWPMATVILCITNDVLWWIPFGLYLYDAWPAFRREFRASPVHRPRHRTGGCLCAQGCAASNAADTRKTVTSSKRRPTI